MKPKNRFLGREQRAIQYYVAQPLACPDEACMGHLVRDMRVICMVCNQYKVKALRKGGHE